jgi:nicotinamidase-related amidase
VELIASVNRTIESAVASGMTVIYICHEDTNPLIKFVTGSRMVKGKNASAIDKRVKIVSENIFVKHIMDGFSNEALHKFLIAYKINTLYMTGLDAEYCVYRTSLGAKNRGYSVNLIEDAVISSTVNKKLNVLKKYKSNGINIINAENFKSISHAVIIKNKTHSGMSQK